MGADHEDDAVWDQQQHYNWYIMRAIPVVTKELVYDDWVIISQQLKWIDLPVLENEFQKWFWLVHDQIYLDADI